MLLMATFEFGYPVRVFVEMESDDSLRQALKLWLGLHRTTPFRYLWSTSRSTLKCTYRSLGPEGSN